METSDVRQLKLAVLGDFALELETGEGLGHLPEFDMATTTGEKDIVGEWGETALEHFLAEGFALKDDTLIDPVPNGQGKIGCAAQADQFGT